jgi:GxxExxY protein
MYDGVRLDEGLRLDVLVEEQVICELKAVDAILPLHQAQLLSQLRLAKKPLGFLLNFHVALMKDGIRRFVL